MNRYATLVVAVVGVVGAVLAFLNNRPGLGVGIAVVTVLAAVGLAWLSSRDGSSRQSNSRANDLTRRRELIDRELQAFEVVYGTNRTTPEGRNPTLTFERMQRSSGSLLRVTSTSQNLSLHGLGNLMVAVSKLQGDRWVDAGTMPLRNLNGQLVGDIPHGFQPGDRLAFRLTTSVPTEATVASA